MSPFHAVTRITAAAALAALCSSTLAAVGARVVVQEWTPIQPDKASAHVLVDDPDVVSRSLAQAWSTARVQICAALKARLATPKIAKGESLYDIDCALDPNAAFTVESAGANALRATFAIRGNSVAATSTVPDPLPRGLDPRFSLTLDATFTVTLAVQADANTTLRVADARFALARSRIDSHNASADVIKFVVDDLIPFFGGPNFKQIAESAINGVSVNLASKFNDALAPVNARLRGPSGYVRVGVWGHPDRITVAFGPREVPPPGGGSIAGLVRWDPAQYPNGSCTSFGLQASVQTGPGALMSPDDYTVLGPAPRRNVGSVTLAPAGANTCRYTITGVPAGWPSAIAPAMLGASPATSGSTKVIRTLTLLPDGWSGAVVANATDKNYRLALYTKSFNVNAMPDLGRVRENPLAPSVSRPDPLNRAAITPQWRTGPQAQGLDATLPANGVRRGTVTPNAQTLPPAASPFAAPVQGFDGAASTSVSPALRARPATEAAAPASSLVR